MSDEPGNPKDDAPEDRQDRGKGSRFGRFARGAGRVAIFPIKNTLRSPRTHILDNEYVWSWAQWRSMAARLSPKAQAQAIEALGEDEKWWADPKRWPESVRSYMLMNMQSAAMLYVFLMVLSLLAIVRGAGAVDISSFARISYFTGGAFALAITGLMYVSCCLDYRRLHQRMSTPRGVLAKQPETYWPFDSDTSFGSFVRSFPGHVRLAWQMRQHGSVKARSAIAQVLLRALIVTFGLAAGFVVLTLVLRSL